MLSRDARDAASTSPNLTVDGLSRALAKVPTERDKQINLNKKSENCLFKTGAPFDLFRIHSIWLPHLLFENVIKTVIFAGFL